MSEGAVHAWTPDPDAVPFSTEAAVAYAERVEALGRAAPIDPVRELSYGDDRGQRLDVYAPDAAHDCPVLVFFHGGSWINGHRGWMRFMAPAVLELGAVFVAGTYRLAPRHRWPAQYDDAREAVRCVHEHAAELGIDRARIVISGHSAGAHLSTLVALKREVPALLAAFPVSCSYDLRYGDVPLDSQEGRVYKYLFSERSQDADASPLNFTAGNTTPFHVTWGEHDLARVTRSSPPFVAALAREAAPVTHSVLPGASHFDCHLALTDPTHDWYVRLRACFETRELPA